MRRIFALSIPLICVLAAALLAAPRTRPHEDASQPQLAYGARVRIVSPLLGAGWHSGVVGQVGPCLAVMIARPGGAQISFTAVRIDDVTRLRLSGRYDGRPDAAGRRREFRDGMDTTGEPWSDLPIAALRARYGGCTPF